MGMWHLGCIFLGYICINFTQVVSKFQLFNFWTTKRTFSKQDIGATKTIANKHSYRLCEIHNIRSAIRIHIIHTVNYRTAMKSSWSQYSMCHTHNIVLVRIGIWKKRKYNNNHEMPSLISKSHQQDLKGRNKIIQNEICIHCDNVPYLLIYLLTL